MSNITHIKSPMSNDSKTLKCTCTSKGTINASDAAKLQLKMGVRCRQEIGEIILAAVRCRPDLIFPTILLIEHKAYPAEWHCTAVKRVCWHLRSTINDGLHFWRTSADPALPAVVTPTLDKDACNVKIADSSEFDPVSFAKANWVANVNTRRYISKTAVF